MIVLGIDPGPEESAWFLWDSELRRGIACGYDHNEVLRSLLQSTAEHYPEVHFACEKVVSYGMPVGATVFDTCYWMGRFWEVVYPRPFHMIPNAVVRGHLCRSSKSKDTNVRAALIEKFGPVGTKKQPGPFYGVSNHVWSAAAVAVTYADRDEKGGWKE